MKIYRRMKLTGKEIDELTELLDGYIWVAMDAKRGIIAAGDEYTSDLRDFLIVKRSKLEDIYGFGLDLKTGEIFYPIGVNMRNKLTGHCGAIPEARKRRIETLVHYFFSDIDPFWRKANIPHYKTKPVDVE